jgi:hypothetical protein
VTDITSATGTPLAWTEYTPFGAPRASAATSQAPVNPFRITGEYRDATTARYHLRARQYDPTTGLVDQPRGRGRGAATVSTR